MSNCKVTLKINSASGTPTEVLVEVPNADSLTLELVIDYIRNNDKDSFDLIISSLNESGWPKPMIKVSDIKEDIPLGNFNVDLLANTFDTDNITWLRDKLVELGVDIGLLNIWVTSAEYGTVDKVGYYTKNGKSIYVLRPNSNSIEPYLKELAIETIYDLSTPDEKLELKGEIEALLEQLKDNISIKNIVDKFQGDKVKDFIKAYYFSTKFNATFRSQIMKTFNDMLDVKKMYANLYKDPVVNEFASFINNDNEVTLDNLKLIGNKLNLTDPVDIIHEINNRVDNGHYFDIKFIGAKSILFRNTRVNPVFDNDIINSEYYGELVTPITTIGGFNITEYNNKYYIHKDKIVQAADLANAKYYNSIREAISIINRFKLPDDKVSLTSLRSNIKLAEYKSSKMTIRSGLKFKVGDRIAVMDLYVGKVQVNNIENSLISKKYGDIIKEFDNHPLWKKVNERLLADGYNIKDLLNNTEKIEAFILLRAFLRRESELGETYKNAYTNRNPRIDTEEKVAAETALSKLALIDIGTVPSVVYEVLGKGEGNITILKVETKDNIPAYRRSRRSFKSELVNISDYLNRNFGIKTNLVTTDEIKKKFKLVVPNAHKVNAFILNGEIYINIDRATTADPIHEFTHIIMGTIKKKKPDLYLSLVNSVESLTDYQAKYNQYTNDGRARPDINEEIFVTAFGEFFSGRKDPFFNGKEELMNELGNEYKKGIVKFLLTNMEVEDAKLGNLLHESVEEIMLEFGSKLLKKDENPFGESIETRTVTNIIALMIRTEQLEEKCLI